MSARRKITLTLTEAEMSALRGAVCLAETEWGEMASDVEAPGGGYFGRELRSLDRAWSKVASAWHAKARRAAQ